MTISTKVSDIQTLVANSIAKGQIPYIEILLTSGRTALFPFVENQPNSFIYFNRWINSGALRKEDVQAGTNGTSYVEYLYNGTSSTTTNLSNTISSMTLHYRE